ncbi:oxidoreductase [Demequina sp. NBRC 110056]|uniref:oxidoreductase n=1 Tax=Demequina sp. NBRC 110056 TaxID=1570345 RepID=UPI001F230132|nr:oxidoreductase [Demequina sp. NBRC 110056]
MSFFSKMFGSKGAESSSNGAASKEARSETITHLKEFVRGHQGCEAFIEPPTRVTQTTMVIVADTGEWTRRRVPDPATARKVAKQLGVPAFDVNLSGYPSRMREWNEKQRKQR